MARSVKGLGVNLFENIVYKHIFSLSRSSRCHTSSDSVISKENSGFLRGSLPNVQSSSCLSTNSRILPSSSPTSDPACHHSPSSLPQQSYLLHNSPHQIPLPLVHTSTTTSGLQYSTQHHHHNRYYHSSTSSSISGRARSSSCGGTSSQQVRCKASFSGGGGGGGGVSGIRGVSGGALGVRVVDHLHHHLHHPSSAPHHLQDGEAAGEDNLTREEEDHVEEVRTPTRSPQTLAEPDLVNIFVDIRKALQCSGRDLQEIACYYFDGQGKVIRPIITVLMARALNNHVSKHHRLHKSQLEIAKVTEMIHTASLLHDDVLDMADTRRGKPSVTLRYGQKKSVMAGDYILSVASMMLARVDNPEVTIVLAQVLADLVQGEFMQLGSKENENERFSHYLAKTFKKTASLIAYSCQAVAILGGADERLQQVCFQYGRNVGIAFQLVDDFLDFVASASIIGKPTSVDLKLGFATAPVLFACEKFPELNPMILRRFHEPGDVAFAFDCVHRSDGLEQTQMLARKHCLEAIRVLDALSHSEEKMALIAITDKVLNRIR